MLKFLERVGGLLSTVYTFWNIIISGTISMTFGELFELPIGTVLILTAVLFLVILLIGIYFQHRKLTALETSNQEKLNSNSYKVINYWDEQDSRFSRAVLLATGRLFPKTIIINGKVERIEHPDSNHPSNQK